MESHVRKDAKREARQSKRVAGVILATFIGFFSQICGAQESSDPPGVQLRVYHIGNSLTRNLPLERLQQLFESVGGSYDYGMQLGGGLRLHQHLVKRNHSGGPGSGKFNTREPYGEYDQGLSNFRFDALVLQPYQEELDAEPRVTSTAPYFTAGSIQAAGAFIEYARGQTVPGDDHWDRQHANVGHIATDRIYIYATWPRVESILAEEGEKTFAAYWNAEYDGGVHACRHYFQSLVEALNAGYPQLPVPVRMIPAGEVFARLDQMIRRRELPGLEDFFERNHAYYERARGSDSPFSPASFQPEQGVLNFYADGVHMNDQPHNGADSGTIGSYVAALTVFATLSGRSPVGMTSAPYEMFDPQADAELIHTLQTVVWETVNGHPYTGVKASWPETSHGRNTLESKVVGYELPDPLLDKNGERIENRQAWETHRRDEILQDFRDLMYGHTPELSSQLKATVEAVHEDAVAGLATRTQVTLQIANDPDAPRIQLMLYLPNAYQEPVPVFLGMNFFGNASVERDPAIPLPQGWMRSSPLGVVDHRATEELRGMNSHRWPLELILKRGFGVATFYYGDVEPDHQEGWREGIRGYALGVAGRKSQRPSEWGALGAWAWGLSRALDYLERYPGVAADRVAVFGHSRLGKAALWAGAQDRRFALVISNNSGEGGAALARRNFGENIAYSVAHASWRYCDRFRGFVGLADELPFDQHMLLALISPRPLYVCSASEDLLADPQGEFLSCVHAEPVYALYDLHGLGATQWPPPGQPLGKHIAYHLRAGEHAITAYDWQQFIQFADRHLR
ncbi:MAG: hypothetical protein NXI32_17100 [bacterium]|nr:hypothetical protein [bacterium]